MIYNKCYLSSTQCVVLRAVQKYFHIEKASVCWGRGCYTETMILT